MTRTGWTGFGAIALLAGSCLAQQPGGGADDRRTLRVDAVELIGGKEMEGKAGHAARHGAYTYLFSSPENLARFQREPQRYEIQLGGACARMGPLSGEGRCDIFTVHDSRLYIFASEQCRAGFLRAPEAVLEKDDAPPRADEAARKRGRDLIELAVKAAGGAERIDAVRTLRQRIERTEEYRGKDVAASDTLILAFPDRARSESTWNESAWGHARAGEQGFFFGGDPRPMADSQIRAFARVCNHHPLAVLRARKAPDFVAASVGSASVGDRPVERVACAFDGTLTTLGIDPATGRILSATYVGRGSGARLGTVHKTFSQWKTVRGVTLPTEWTATFDGEPVGDKPTAFAALEIDVPLDEALFRPQ